MKLFVCCFSLLIISLFYTSCLHHNDDTMGGPAGADDSIYLKTIIGLNPTFITGLDTSTKMLFHYDALKRLASFDFFSCQPGMRGTVMSHYIEKRLYHNNEDALPFNIVY